jgi:hypothetical protein
MSKRNRHDSFTGKKLHRNFKKDTTNSGASKAIYKSNPYQIPALKQAIS